MAVHTLLLDFPIGASSVFAERDGFVRLENLIQLSLQKFIGPNSIKKLWSGETDAIWSGPRDSLVTIRLYADKALATVTIEYYLNDGESVLLSYDDCKELETSWANETKATKNVKTLPRILRGIPFDIYFPTTDERILEYDIDGILFDQHSRFQHVQVAHSKTFGNMLVLDNDPNIGESDLIYTESIMRRGQENYANKEILILGGGDGVLLHELLKENPKKVTMIEIDEVVMAACKEHLRSACGTVLDQTIGPNYEIIIGDCFPKMMELRDRNVKFDYIFGDLTTVPINSGPSDEAWDFVRKVLNLAFSVLKPGGKYMTHSPGTSDPSSAAILEDLLLKQYHIDFTLKLVKSEAFVPSFSENWNFYMVQSIPSRARPGITPRENENKA